MEKNPIASARDTGSIPGLGRFLEEEMAPYPSILAWRVPWTEKSAGLVCGVRKSGHD